jgi:hypothetical protein
MLGMERGRGVTKEMTGARHMARGRIQEKEKR